MAKAKNEGVTRMNKPLLKRVQTEARRRDVPGKTMLNIIVKEWFDARKAEKARK